jgi:hypothetical protein
MLAKFRFTRTVNKDGEKGYLFNEAEKVIELSKLSKSYLKGYPHFYRYNYSELVEVVLSENEQVTMRVGRFFTEEEYNIVITAIKEAGDRLTTIRADIRKLKTEWNGDVEVII